MDEDAGLPFARETRDELLRSETKIVDTRKWLAGLRGVERVYETYSYDEEIRGHWEQLSPHLTRSSTVVDVGCGLGMYAERFSTSIGRYIGIDMSRVSLAFATSALADKTNVEFARASAYRLPLLSSSVDAIICAEVIEHVPDPAAFLNELSRVLRSGGVLSLSTPNAYLMLTPYHLAMAVKHPRLYYRYWRPERDWEQAISWHPAVRPAILRRWVSEAGFDVKMHRSLKWYYHTPLSPAFRFWRRMERIMPFAHKGFSAYLRLTRFVLQLPFFRWLGTRQFILGMKPEST